MASSEQFRSTMWWNNFWSMYHSKDRNGSTCISHIRWMEGNRIKTLINEHMNFEIIDKSTSNLFLVNTQWL